MGEGTRREVLGLMGKGEGGRGCFMVYLVLGLYFFRVIHEGR